MMRVAIRSRSSVRKSRNHFGDPNLPGGPIFKRKWPAPAPSLGGDRPRPSWQSLPGLFTRFEHRRRSAMQSEGSAFRSERLLDTNPGASMRRVRIGLRRARDRGSWRHSSINGSGRGKETGCLWSAIGMGPGVQVRRGQQIGRGLGRRTSRSSSGGRVSGYGKDKGERKPPDRKSDVHPLSSRRVSSTKPDGRKITVFGFEVNN